MSQPSQQSRRIRVFVSSTFRDMMEERDALMAHAWPELRRFCRERQVELVEVDLRWGISEEQSARNETLKLCLDEIRACRPFFIGLLGERYGWIPSDDVLTPDLREEQPWLTELRGKSVTEMEMRHGVLNNPAMAGRAFFYFRDPAYAHTRGADFQAESPDTAAQQAALKAAIRSASTSHALILHDHYTSPLALAELVQADLEAAIDADFPKESIPDPLTRDAQAHETFADTRRRTYIGRPDYFQALEQHARVEGGPLVVLGESGSGKSALLANWVAHWRERHPEDFILQHYIGSTADSADHWQLMKRVVGEIARWTNDPEALPQSHEELLQTFPVWLAKARSVAQRKGIRCILVVDALNQLVDQDHAHQLGWLPAHSFLGPLRLLTSTLPGDTLEAVTLREWVSLRVAPLSTEERRRMIAAYLARFSKTLNAARTTRLAEAPQAATPLYLKIILDELRVTGTHERLDERLTRYLTAPDIPTLLQLVLTRYQRDYERERPALVKDALGLLWAARRGLSETELLQLLKPADQPQLPAARWAPLRAALEEHLVERDGLLNFAHDFLRTAVETAFVPDEDTRDTYRLQLADYFEAQPISARTCDELPWLLWQTESLERLRSCLLNIDRFFEIHERDKSELLKYWVSLGKERAMGQAYVASFTKWITQPGREENDISAAAHLLSMFLLDSALHPESEALMHYTISIAERNDGPDHPNVAARLHNLAWLLYTTNRGTEAEALMRRALAMSERTDGPDHPNVASRLSILALKLEDDGHATEAEPLLRRALSIDESFYGPDHPIVATRLHNLASLLQDTNRASDAESLYRRALVIKGQHYGADHSEVADTLNNLGTLLLTLDRISEAETLLRRTLVIREERYGPDHPSVATTLGNLAGLLDQINGYTEAETLYRRALSIDERRYGPNHPSVATSLNNLAGVLEATNRASEAELLYRRALAIDECTHGPNHPSVGLRLNNLAGVLRDTNHTAEAEPLYRRALAINERSFEPTHPRIATTLNNLSLLLQSSGRNNEAEPLYRRALAIEEHSYGPDHSSVATTLNNLAGVLQATDRSAEAEPLYRRALAIEEHCYGLDHPRICTTLNNLAALLKDAGRLADAEHLFRRALSIDKRSSEPDLVSIATTLNNLALLLQSSDRASEAEPLYHRSLAMYEQRCGPDHPRVATTLNNLALMLQSSGRNREAEPLYRRALSINEHSLGPNHLSAASTLNNLGWLLQSENRLAESEPLYRRALAITELHHGSDHPAVATALNSLASLLQSTDQSTEAEPLYRRALAITELHHGPDHPAVATTLNSLAWLLQSAQRLTEAELLYRRALAIIEQQPEPNHREVATTLNSLAWLLQSTDRSAEAEPLYRRALRIHEQIYGPDHPKVASVLNQLAWLLRFSDRPTEAETCYRRALAIQEHFGSDTPDVAWTLGNLAILLQSSDQLPEAESLVTRSVNILLSISFKAGTIHPDLQHSCERYKHLLHGMGCCSEEIRAKLNALGQPYGISFGNEETLAPS